MLGITEERAGWRHRVTSSPTVDQLHRRERTKKKEEGVEPTPYLAFFFSFEKKINRKSTGFTEFFTGRYRFSIFSNQRFLLDASDVTRWRHRGLSIWIFVKIQIDGGTVLLFLATNDFYWMRVTSLGDVTGVCRFLSKKNHLDLEDRQADFRVTKKMQILTIPILTQNLRTIRRLMRLKWEKRKRWEDPGKTSSKDRDLPKRRRHFCSKKKTTGAPHELRRLERDPTRRVRVGLCHRVGTGFFYRVLFCCCCCCCCWTYCHEGLEAPSLGKWMGRRKREREIEWEPPKKIKPPKKNSVQLGQRALSFGRFFF